MITVSYDNIWFVCYDYERYVHCFLRKKLSPADFLKKGGGVYNKGMYFYSKSFSEP